MGREVIHKDDNLLLEYVEKGNYLHETWWGLTPSPIFLKLLDIIINALEKKKADGLILDAREHLGLREKDQEEAAKRHEKYAKEHGILKQAIIVPRDFFSEHSVKNYATKFDGSNYNEIRYFQDVTSAEKWLQNKS